MPERVEIATPASPQEAAAVIAAVQQFRRDHAPVIATAAPKRNAWQWAGLLEGTGRTADAASPWGDPAPWS